MKKQGCSVALGFFDGVHMAHKEVLCTAVSANEHSIAVIINRPGGKKLITQSLKQKAILDLGISEIIEFAFDEIKNLSCEEFVIGILKNKLGAQTAVCGCNFHFGHGGTGDSGVLETFCKREGIRTYVTPPVIHNGIFVSSTKIRELLSAGELKQANELLTRPFSYDFEVAHGEMRGRKMGFPTINQAFESEFFTPKSGVYASKVIARSKEYIGVTNIGIRPTFGSTSLLSETNILDFNGDLYGQKVLVFLYEYLRPEEKYESMESLKQQIFKDSQKAKQMLKI